MERTEDRKVEVIVDAKEKIDELALRGLNLEDTFAARQRLANRTLGPVIESLVRMDPEYRAGKITKEKLIEQDYFVCLHANDMYAMLTQEQIEFARKHPNVSSVIPTIPLCLKKD